MLFNSLTFVVFFAVVLALHHGPFSWRQKKIHLLLASYLFYAAWNPPFVCNSFWSCQPWKSVPSYSRINRKRAMEIPLPDPEPHHETGDLHGVEGGPF